MGLVISLANQKGGVAKTTTCVNLGAGLALRENKTLLIDFDPQGSLTQYFGINTEDPHLATVGDWMMDRKPLEAVVKPTKFASLFLLPTNENLKSDEALMQKDIIKSFRFLQKKVDRIKDQYDYILIDTMPSFSLLFVNSLAACDKVLVPVKVEFLSIQGIGPLISKIQDVRDDIKPIEILGVVGTFYRNGVRECESCLGELRKSLPGHVMKTIIHLNSKVAESAAFTLPIQHFDVSSQGSKDYEELTEEVIAKCGLKKGVATL